MRLEYVGPKTLISASGVSFDTNKKDKFIYLDCILQLMQAIDHEYIEDKIYTYTTDRTHPGNSEMIQMIKQYCPDIETVISKAEENAALYIDAKLERARSSTLLNEEEIRVLINNITLMRHYTIQRFINKCTYYYVVKKFIENLKDARVSYVSVPVHTTFFHVLHTIRKCLLQQKSPINSQLAFHQKESSLFVKMNMINF